MPELTEIAKSLPEIVPFVGPETQERSNGFSFRARLGANESVFGPSKKVKESIINAVDLSWMYGDPENFILRDTLADFYRLKKENFIIGEGIDGLLGCLVRLFIQPGETVVTSLGAYPTFNYHVVGFGGKLSLVPYKDYYEDPKGLINEAIRVNAKMIYFANPDNPMGTFHSKKVMQELIDNLPESTLLCLDEAYSDFVEKEELTPLDVSNRNVIRLRTFSKAYGLAGLRIGYGIGSESLISEFNKVRNHFGVNKIAQIAAVTSLHDQDHLKKVKIAVEDSKISIKKIFGRYGFSCLNSKTNFLAIDCGKDSDYATKLLKELIREKIFVRMPAVHPLNSFIRVSAGRSKDLKELDLALSKVMKRI